jgi:GNAT superfamily N-acetyltransferase
LRYSIALARPRDLAPLPGIELRAAQLLRGHAPLPILAETTSEEDFRVAQAAGRLWVALAGDDPVGFAIVEMLDDDRVEVSAGTSGPAGASSAPLGPERQLPHLEEIDVDPPHGRRGLGTSLVRAVCDWTVASGFSELTLTTFRAVPWNMPFYARLGFEVVPPAEQRPALARVVEYEAARGLDPAQRCAMRWRPGT